MHKAYKITLFYFSAFVLLLLVSASLLFAHKSGISIVGIQEYYLGNEEKFMLAKTTEGMLKSSLAHFFLFGLFGFVLLHFLRFTKNYKRLRLFVIFYMSIALLEILSGFFIVWFGGFFAYVKLFSFLVNILLICYSLLLLVHSIFTWKQEL